MVVVIKQVVIPIHPSGHHGGQIRAVFVKMGGSGVITSPGTLEHPMGSLDGPVVSSWRSKKRVVVVKTGGDGAYASVASS